MFTLNRIDSELDFLPWLELVNEQASTRLYFPSSSLDDQAINYPPLHRPGSVIYALRLGSLPAGWCQVVQHGRTLHIEGLFVRASLRGRGLGHRTLHRIEYNAPQRITWIALKVHRSNPAARRLYRHCKFNIICFDHQSGFFRMIKRRSSGLRCAAPGKNKFAGPHPSGYLLVHPPFANSLAC